MTFKIASRLLAATITLAPCASAQARFCIGGALDHLSPSEVSSCNAKLQSVRHLATVLQAPDQWHFVLVCGEVGWSEYSVYSTGEAQALKGVSAETIIESHETFIRETSLDEAELASFHGIVAHEVAAAAVQSLDEIAIRDEMARRSFALPIVGKP